MKLQRLTKNNIEKLNGKKIYCIEKSLSYLNELCDTFDILDQIDCIVDDRTKNEEGLEYRGKKLNIRPLSELANIDFNHTAILITSDYYREIFESICVKGFGKEYTNIDIFFFPNRETEYEMEYRDRYKESELEDIIIFCSGPHKSQYVKGMDFSDNARALFEYLLENGYNKKYELVWFVKDPEEFSYYNEFNHVSFLSYESSTSYKDRERNRYYRALCLAKYIFFTDAYGFARNCREDQIRIQLWHGCGFKTRLNFASCEKRYEYTTVTSDLYAKIHGKIFGLNPSQMLITGIAKEDWLFTPLKNWKELLGIPNAKQYIFWLPTYRFSEAKFSKPKDGNLNEETGLPLIDSIQKLNILNTLLSKNDIVLIIKLHPFQDKNAISLRPYSNIKIIDNDSMHKNRIEINQLLGHADAIISDYSSVAVDYMILDRPMAFSVEDAEEYKNNRGFIFDPISKWLPGKLLFSFPDILEYINEIIQGIDSEKEKRKKLIELMHEYKDDKNSKRIVETLGIRR